MLINERDARKMVPELAATGWCLRERKRARELTFTYRLERMRRLRMLEEQEA